MGFIQQQDIINLSVTYATQVSAVKSTTQTELQNQVTATVGALGYSNAFTSRPIQIKSGNTSSTNGWDDIQNWTIYNVGITTTIPISTISGTGIIASTATVSITTGDLVGIFGPGAWSASNDLNFTLNAVESNSGCGSIIAGLIAPTSKVTTSQFFNGSLWSAGVNVLYNVSNFSLRGSQNSAYKAGGLGASSVTYNELFNGSTWAASGNLTQSRSYVAGTGSVNAGLIINGSDNGSSHYFSTTESFNGSTWTFLSNNTIFSRRIHSSGGSFNNSILNGGYNGSFASLSVVEGFNGSSWCLLANTSVSIVSPTTTGNSASGFMLAGDNGQGTLQYLSPQIFNGSVWYSSGNMSASRSGGIGFGVQTNAAIVGGNALKSTEIHSQSTFSKITFENYLSASSLGIAYGVTSTTCNIKSYGYIDNLSISSNNINITTPLQWVNTFWVLTRNSTNTFTTSNPNFTMVKTVPDSEDLVLGWNLSQTQMFIFLNKNFGFSQIGSW